MKKAKKKKNLPLRARDLRKSTRSGNVTKRKLPRQLFNVKTRALY